MSGATKAGKILRALNMLYEEFNFDAINCLSKEKATIDKKRADNIHNVIQEIGLDEYLLSRLHSLIIEQEK